MKQDWAIALIITFLVLLTFCLLTAGSGTGRFRFFILAMTADILGAVYLFTGPWVTSGTAVIGFTFLAITGKPKRQK